MSEDIKMKLSARRERALDDLAAVISELWGTRCSRNEGGCLLCAAWTLFDCMADLTDSSRLGDAPLTRELVNETFGINNGDQSAKAEGGKE